MVKKIRRVRTFARTASKSMEKNLINNAKKLKNNPYLVLPEYSDNYSKKCFRRVKKSLDKIINILEDINKLEKLSNKKTIDSAVAGTILLAHSEKAPYLAVARFSTGDITYAQRGRSDKEKLISCQHFDNPILRLLGIKDIAIKKNLHVYSWDNGFISTGLISKPPEEFISYVIKKIGFNFKDGSIHCNHIINVNTKNKKFCNNHYLNIFWKSGNINISICENCAKSSKNTFFNITKYMIEPDISKNFIIKVFDQLVKDKDNTTQSTDFVEEYILGKLNDYDLINKNIGKRKESIKQSEGRLFILNGESYGSDIKNFINALKPNKYEKIGLEKILNRIEEPVLFDNVTANKVLEYYWDKHGLYVIDSIIEDNKISENFFSLKDTPSEILELVFEFKERQNILSKLPKYKNLPPLAKLADHIARTYKTYGEEKLISELNKVPNNHKFKSLAYAFLIVIGKGRNMKWKFDQVEIESGEFLEKFAKKLLDSNHIKYHYNLKLLVEASGESEDIESYKL